MENNNKQGCLSGCLMFLAIVGICFVIVVAVFIFKGRDMVNLALDKTKGGIVQLLSEDHTDFQKQEFVNAYSNLLEDIKAKGYKQGILEHQKLIEMLSSIVEDKKINKVESKKWMELYKSDFSQEQSQGV